MLEKEDKIVIVVGFYHDKVIEEALKYRRDVTFVFNHDYLNSGNVDSLFEASQYCSDSIIVLDGDLVISPEDFRRFQDSEEGLLGYTDVRSRDYVGCELEQYGSRTLVNSFSRDKAAKYEFSGPIRVSSSRVRKGQYFLHEMLEEYLPIQGVRIDAIDIDTEQDYEYALKISQKFY